MKILYKLLRFEMKIMNRSYHLIRNNIYLLILSSVIFSMVLPEEFLTTNIKMLMCFWGVIISSLMIPHYLVKIDVQDGSLETLISTISHKKIFIAKYLALAFSLIISTVLATSVTTLFFAFSAKELLYLSLLMLLAILQITALILLGNIIHAYFRRNTNMLIALIIPLIIPTLVIGAIALETLNFDFIMILLGVDIVIIPIIFYLSSYLLSNLYDF